MSAFLGFHPIANKIPAYSCDCPRMEQDSSKLCSIRYNNQGWINRMSDDIINIILLLLSVIVGSLVFVLPLILHHKEGRKKFTKEHIPLLIASCSLMVGTRIRVCLLDQYPGGLNQDEASAGYDAYSILKYGIDHNGRHYPRHLIAWGSGQNALYCYLAIPFIARLGNTALALRLPMAILSSLTLYILFFTLRKRIGEKKALLFTLFLIINPWHIRKSRWALECNIFPDLVLISSLLLAYGVSQKNYFFYYFSAILFGFSAYSYGTSYFFLFFFIISFLVYLFIKKPRKRYHQIIYLGVRFVRVVPIILFLYINIFNKETIHYLWFDIPKLKTDRFHTVTSVFSANFLNDCFNNFKNCLRLVFLQNDGLRFNNIPYFGTLYLFTLPFSLIGMLHPLFNKKKRILLDRIDSKVSISSLLYFILADSRVVSFLLSFILDSNINRINIIWIPLVFFGALGVSDIIHHRKWTRVPLCTAYAASFLAFSFYYPIHCNEKITPNFFPGLKEAVQFSLEKKPEHVYITPHANYTLVLYYSEYETPEYVRSVTFYNPGAAFENPKDFTGYSFYLPKERKKGNIYICQDYEDPYQDVSCDCRIIRGRYIVYDRTI